MLEKNTIKTVFTFISFHCLPTNPLINIINPFKPAIAPNSPTDFLEKDTKEMEKGLTVYVRINIETKLNIMYDIKTHQNKQKFYVPLTRYEKTQNLCVKKTPSSVLS